MSSPSARAGFITHTHLDFTSLRHYYIKDEYTRIQKSSSHSPSHNIQLKNHSPSNPKRTIVQTPPKTPQKLRVYPHQRPPHPLPPLPPPPPLY
mmetsp:Transcript_32403/g.52432  ORF Transcript_32403/g.52432 Transcript_32403/m.52432 type:complete len:93 (+) Transcript_32403:107-385(+)